MTTAKAFAGAESQLWESRWPASDVRAGEETVVGSVEKESGRCILESIHSWAVRLGFLVSARHVRPLVPYCRLSRAKLSPVFGNYIGSVATMKILISPIRKSIEPEECGLTAWEGEGGAGMSAGVRGKAEGHLPPHPALTASAPSLWTLG